MLLQLPQLPGMRCFVLMVPAALAECVPPEISFMLCPDREMIAQVNVQCIQGMQ